MKKCLLTIATLLLVIIVSCSRNQKKEDVALEIKVLDLTKTIEEEPFNLSDYYDNIRMIKLETNDNCIIKDFNGFVGNNYIVAFEGEKILQFTGDGKFIGTIAHKGNGPNEYSRIDAWDVDAKEQNLIYHDSGKDYIKKYNLENGLYENNIPFADSGSLNGLLSVNDTLLAVFPSIFSQYGYLYFFQTTRGKIIEGMTKEPLPRPKAYLDATKFIYYPDNSYILQPSECDTLFRIKDSKFIPIYRFITKKPVKSGSKTKSIISSFAHLDKDRMFISEFVFESNITPTSSFFTINDKSNYLCYNLKEDRLFKVKSFFINIVEIPFEVSEISFQHNNKIHVNFQAIDLKENIEEKLEDSEIPEQKKSELKKLNAGISEYDNPILFYIE